MANSSSSANATLSKMNASIVNAKMTAPTVVNAASMAKANTSAVVNASTVPKVNAAVMNTAANAAMKAPTTQQFSVNTSAGVPSTNFSSMVAGSRAAKKAPVKKSSAKKPQPEPEESEPKKTPAKKTAPSSKKPSKKSGGALMDDIKNLAVPFAILLAKQGLEGSFDDKKKDSERPSSKQVRSSSMRRRSMAGGQGCPACAHTAESAATMTGGARQNSAILQRKFNNIAKDIEEFLGKY